MGGALKSTKGFLGLDNGPTVSPQNYNQSLEQLNNQNKLYYNSAALDKLNNYATGQGTASDALNMSDLTPDERAEMGNALATGATTGSKFATDQVNSNSILGGLYGSSPSSQLSQAEDRQNYLTNNGYSLTKEDNDALGQASGNIARQYGTQENSLAQALANHGMSAAPSGAAAIQFTGLQGNKNEALANMQNQIAQERLNFNRQAIADNANFLSSLGGQAANAIQRQYQRQLSGAQQQRSGLENTANIQNQANAAANTANLGAANFKEQNAPMNFADALFGGASIGAGSAGITGGQKAGASLFGSGASGAGAAGAGGAASSGAGAAALASDVNLKENIEPADAEIEEFLSEIGAHSYKYKNPETHGQGRFVSPMAQELEKTELGKSMIEERPDGKYVNYARGFGVMLAAQAMLNRKLNELLAKS